MFESMVFYKSFFEATENLPAEDYKEAITAILKYGIYGEEPDNLSVYSQMFFTMAKPLIDSNKKRREAAKRGGEANNNESSNNENDLDSETESEANGKQTEANCKQTEANENENENENENIYNTRARACARGNAHEILSKKQLKLFEMFYSAYPKRVARAKAEKAWDKIRPSPNEEFVRIVLDALEKAKKYDKRFFDDEYIPNPATWLNAKEWLNEYDTRSINVCKKQNATFMQRENASIGGIDPTEQEEKTS